MLEMSWGSVVTRSFPGMCAVHIYAVVLVGLMWPSWLVIVMSLDAVQSVICLTVYIIAMFDVFPVHCITLCTMCIDCYWPCSSLLLRILSAL
jgi:hypothetical protein